jgi:hypothetical protein
MGSLPQEHNSQFILIKHTLRQQVPYGHAGTVQTAFWYMHPIEIQVFMAD